MIILPISQGGDIYVSFAYKMLGTLLGSQRGSISAGWCYHEFFLTCPISSPSLAVPTLSLHTQHPGSFPAALPPPG